MSVSRDEQAALAAMETALREQDPALARTLTTFTRPRRSRWLWAVLVGLLILVPAVLTIGFTLHSRVLITVGAVLVGALFTTVAVIGGSAGDDIATVDDPECGR